MLVTGRLVFIALRILSAMKKSITVITFLCLQIPLPNRPHWFLLFGATEEEIQEICLKILQLYTRKKVLCLFTSRVPLCLTGSIWSESCTLAFLG